MREGKSYVSYELYHLIRSAMSHGLELGETNCRFVDVIHEFPIGEKRAYLVVFAEEYGRVHPHLVIEVKQGAFMRPGRSVRAAVKKAFSYANRLSRLFGRTLTSHSMMAVPLWLLGVERRT